MAAAPLLLQTTLTDGVGHYILFQDGSILIVSGYGKDGQKIAAGSPQAKQMIKNLSYGAQIAQIERTLNPSLAAEIRSMPDLPSKTSPGLPEGNDQLVKDAPKETPFYMNPWVWAGVGTTALCAGLVVWALWPSNEDEDLF